MKDHIVGRAESCARPQRHPWQYMLNEELLRNRSPNMRAVMVTLLCLAWISSALLAEADKNDQGSESIPREFQGLAPDSGHRGVIDDPDGYVNVRSRADAESPIVAKVKTGDRFSFERKDYDKWCRVKLSTGKSGWMDAQRILLFFTKDDLPPKLEKGDEIDEQARNHGVDYYGVTQGAVRGDVEARKQFFHVGDYADGAGAEEHDGVLSVVIHLIGDDALAEFLQAQPVAFQTLVRHSIDDNVTYPFRSSGYLLHHFPKTAKIFFRREMTDWRSPDGRYAIHKKFSDEYIDDDSKVIRSELIEKKTGKVVLDLTKEDVGVGRWKEGEILWSPDSKHFSFSSNSESENKFLVFQASGEKFVKVNLPSADEKIPTVADDPELKDAKFDGEYAEVDPVHWIWPNVIAFRKHLRYQRGDKPDGLDRRYDICMTIADDGKVTCQTKVLTAPAQ